MLPEQPAHDDMDEDDNVSSKHFMFSDSGDDCMASKKILTIEDDKLEVTVFNELQISLSTVLMIDYWF